jgi:hypothetical protein
MHVEKQERQSCVALTQNASSTRRVARDEIVARYPENQVRVTLSIQGQLCHCAVCGRFAQGHLILICTS